MTPAQETMSAIIRAGEGTRKAGFTVGSVTYTLNQNDTLTATVVIPTTTSVDPVTGIVSITAQDYLEFPA